MHAAHTHARGASRRPTEGSRAFEILAGMHLLEFQARVTVQLNQEYHEAQRETLRLHITDKPHGETSGRELPTPSLSVR